jgi:hypothetical protein
MVRTGSHGCTGSVWGSAAIRSGARAFSARTIDILSYGADGKAGGEANDADMGSGQ